MTKWLLICYVTKVLPALLINMLHFISRGAHTLHEAASMMDSQGIGAKQIDFLSVAVHELVHVLGFGTAPSWNTKNLSVPISSSNTFRSFLRMYSTRRSASLTARSVAWWAMSAVLPDPHNRITLRGSQLQINYLPNNREAHDRLVYRWIDTLKQVESDPDCHVVKPAPTHPRGEAPLTVMGSVCGTCRMGSNPATSVVDLHCRSHELNNLYIADASVFPSCPAVGLGLTVIANALRIGDQVVAAL